MADPAADAGWLEWSETPQEAVLAAGGHWNVANAGRLDAELGRLAAPAAGHVRCDVAGLDRLDTAGAWLLHRTMTVWREAGAEVALSGARPEHAAMLRQVADSYQPCEVERPPVNAIVRLLTRVGRSTVHVIDQTGCLVAFFGASVLVLGRLFAHPRRLRVTSVVFHMEQAGLNAVPIISLISFLVGIVLAYQGADQLRKFGAEVYVVDLLAISVLREVGILLTAIVIAGRSGSAFTAQLGSMKVNEEVDALRTLGLDPLEVLVIPRLLALMITLPMLTFVADLMGLLGGAVMAWASLGIQPGLFIGLLNDAVSVTSFWIGMIKAPFFALLIALVGCYEGLQVAGSAESVGRQTTRSVVEGIFLVVIVNAAFSIFFSLIGW